MVGAARIVTVLDFLENANSIQIIVVRWLHQLPRRVHEHIDHSEGGAIAIIDDNTIHVVGVSRVTGFDVIQVVGTTTDVEVKIIEVGVIKATAVVRDAGGSFNIIFRNDGGGFWISFWAEILGVW